MSGDSADSASMQHVVLEHKRALDDALFGHEAFAAAWLSTRIERLHRQYEDVRTTLRFVCEVANLQHRVEEPFELFIVGEGKHGKSTLLNAIVGEELSPVHFLPETRCFLRFVLGQRPSDEATVFARLVPGTHDDLATILGPGEQSPLFQLTRHQISIELAEKLVSQETERARTAGASEPYETGLYEVERTISLPGASPLGDLRIVDTQGLNQIFPEEVRRLAETCDAKTTEDRLQQWFESTSRGRHLEWQFRRCDAALWVVHARRANSAISRAATSYFQRYGKVSVLVVTHIDQIPDDGLSRKRILDRFRETMGDKVAAVCAVDARRALQGVLDGDADAQRTSGFSDLVSTLHDLCIRRGRLVRGIGLYNAIRQTQREQYLAVSTLQERLRRAIDLLEAHRKCVREFAEWGISSIESSHERAIMEGRSALRAAIRRVELADNESDVMNKLQPDIERDNYHAKIGPVYRYISHEAENLARRLNSEKFDLPSFGADGRTAGVSVQAEIRNRTLDIKVPYVNLDLVIKWRVFERIKITVVGWISKEKANEMRAKAEREMRDEISGFVDKAWSRFDRECRKKLAEPIRMLERSQLSEIDRVQNELEKAEGLPLMSSLKRVDEALMELAVPPIYAATVLQALRAVAHQGKESHG